MLIFIIIPRRDGLVVSVFASHAVGRGFVPRPVIQRTIITMVKTASLLGTHVLGFEFALTVQPDCLKGRKCVCNCLRTIITKIRISAHQLRIETGRSARTHIERHNRLCTLCNTRDIEDEHHFFFICQIYSNLRKRYILPYFYKRPSMYKLCMLLNTTDFDKLFNLAKFANYAFS